MADPISSLRATGAPSLFDQLSTAGQISQEDQYAANPENQFAKGLRTGAAGLTASSFASEALRKEASGDAGFTDPRDRALQTVQDTQMYAPRVSSLRDVGSVSDLGDFAAGAIGQGAMSMAPSLAGAVLTRGRGPAGKATAFGGAMVPAYEQERGEAALNQYQDPELAKASVEDRDMAASAKGVVNAALESIVPAGLGSSILRKPAGSLLGHVGRDAVTEGATEGAQQLVGFGAEKYLDPNRQLDPWDIADAVAAGALTGGAMSGATRAPSHLMPGEQQQSAAPADVQQPGEPPITTIGSGIEPSAPDGGAAPTDALALPAPEPQPDMFDQAADLGAAAADKAKDVAGKAKTVVGDAINRMSEAASTAQNPGEFIQKVFGGDIGEQAAADLNDTDPSTLRGATFEETEANIARDEQDRAVRAARYAQTLIDDPATPDSVKERVAAMQGDFSNPADQKYLTRTLVSMRGGEKFRGAIDSAVDAAKSLYAKGKDAASDAMESLDERIIKKNLQSATESEHNAYGKVIFDNLTDAAKADGYVRAQLNSVTNALMAFAAKTGDMTPADVKALTKMSDVMTLFKDPDAMITQLMEYANLPRDSASFLSRIKDVTNAQQDIKQPNSFLVASLTPDATDNMKTSELNQLARMVDSYGHENLSKAQADQFVEGLASVFGSAENARVVLDYYAKANKVDLRFSEHEGLVGPDQNMEAYDTPKGEAYRFANPKKQRPFFKGRKDADNARSDGTLGEDSKQTKVPYSEYVKERGLDPESEVTRLLKDIEERANYNKNEAARRGEDRTEMVNALRGEWAIVNRARKEGGAEAALDMYEVLRAEGIEPNNLKATDEDLQKYAAKKSGARVTFTKTDGKEIMLSAESMWKSFGDKEKGTTKGGAEGGTERARRLFKEAVASVLARDDIAGLKTDIDGIKLDYQGTVLNEKLSPADRAAIKEALDKSSVDFEKVQKHMERVVETYQSLPEDDPETKSWRWEARDYLNTRVKDGQRALDGAKTAPQRAAIKRKLEAYLSAQAEIVEFDRGFEAEGGIVEEKEGGFRLRKEMDTSSDIRRTEEDTGAEIGGRAPTNLGPRNAGSKAPTATPAPAANSRAKAAKINDETALSDSALTALHDVVVKENWGRLDTPQKVLKFVAMAKKAQAQLSKIDELDRSDLEDDLRLALNDLFHDKMAERESLIAKAQEDLKKKLGVSELTWQQKNEATDSVLKKRWDLMQPDTFDWEMLLREVDASEADYKVLEGLLRPKAEPGASRQSTMKPKRGRPGKIDRQAILDEIERIRGKDVKVVFDKFANIGASGEFSMDKNKTKRLIKIAVNSLNPMGVAWHESLHDFVAMLGGSKAERKLKEDLLAAAEAPQVVTKLRELLKDHPKAIEQIETDREERLAYMYQFWAEGALKLGPTGTNIFQRMARFFREMVGVLSQEEKIEQLLMALHTGKFSEPSLVQDVLEDLKAHTLGDKLREVSGPIGDAAEAMLTGATDRLRNTNVEALQELADMFHREPDREKQGELPFLQRRSQQVGKRLNALQDILASTTAEDRRRALENMQAMKPASSDLEKKLAKYLADMHTYMVDSGVKRFDSKSKSWVDLGHVSDYFPRVWGKEAIRNNEADFKALLETYIGKDQANKTFNALVNGDGSLELAENEHTLGFTPWNPAVMDRKFTFIEPSNAEQFAKYQVKDMADIMTSYTQRAVHRAEYAKSFGNDGEVITKKFLEAQRQGATVEEIEMARKATMAMEGTLGHNFNPRLKEVMSGIVTYQNIVLLPLSLFSSLVDPLGVAMRSNDMKEAWKAFTYGMKGLADQIRGAGPDEATEMAKMLGIIDEQNMLESMGHVYNSMHMSRFMKNINSKFFRYNGMEMWNQRMRVAATMAAQRFIISQADVLSGQISQGENGLAENDRIRHAKRYFSELGITEKDVFVASDGRLALTKDQLLAAGARKKDVDAIEQRIQAAVFKWVDGAVLRPNAAHRPIWGSDPRYQLIFHLKQFTFSFHNTILRRVGEEMRHGNATPSWILMSYVPFMFLSDVLRGSLTGTLNTSADLLDVASQSVARSGILGTGVFAEDAMGDINRGKLPGTSFLGPAFDHLTTLLSGITGQSGVGQVIDRSVPFAKYM